MFGPTVSKAAALAGVLLLPALGAGSLRGSVGEISRAAFPSA
jgi:hypothetical protein